MVEAGTHSIEYYDDTKRYTQHVIDRPFAACRSPLVLLALCTKGLLPACFPNVGLESRPVHMYTIPNPRLLCVCRLRLLLTYHMVNLPTPPALFCLPRRPVLRSTRTPTHVLHVVLLWTATCTAHFCTYDDTLPLRRAPNLNSCKPYNICMSNKTSVVSFTQMRR